MNERMEEKNKFIENYIIRIAKQIIDMGIDVTDEQINKLINKFKNSEQSIEEITKEIDTIVKEFLSNFFQRKKAKHLHNLQVPYNGITLNNQDIDLMLIAGADNIEELQEALEKITNIRIDLDRETLTQEGFTRIREHVYNMYLNNLTSKNDYIKNRKIALVRKISYLKSSGLLSNEEISILDSIISSSKSNEEIVDKLAKSFSPDKIHRIYETLRDFSPVEKSGIKRMTLEASRSLLEEIKRSYNSITIDEEAKYGKIVLQDETFDFRHLQKSLDFAKKLNKKVRLNTLLFYMDCPEELYNLEKNLDNKTLVKQKLINYVNATTQFISENGYTDTVRSIDVFNELLNRFAMTGEEPYRYRGDIPQLATQMLNGEFIVDDNIKSGWLKHLDIEDLCEVIAIARKNLPNTDFMYNDDNIIDPKKLDPTLKLLKQIREQEEILGVKLLDSIGTQMHIDNGMTKDQMREMIIGLSQFGLPIEITEFDMVMTHGVERQTEEQIEILRQAKINEIYEIVDELREQYNIRGFTIWSKTDTQNFRVTLENEARIARGEEPIETLHGGYYTEEMQPKGKSLTKNNSQSFNYHTHTFRCGHAEMKSDREYVERAKQNGITQLGFSDHIPVTDLEFQNEEQQMHISEVDEYLESIRSLQEEYHDMTIISGFEAEYNPMKAEFLCELREKADYMILGQHYVPSGIGEYSKNNPEYPLRYAEIVCRAMDTGIFDIVAHPDIFMKYRDSVESEEDKRLFFENAKIASRQICEKAKSLGIPLELNFGGIISEQKLNDGQYGYPHSLFWEIARETEAPVLYGVDAHAPSHFDQMSKYKTEVDKIINPSKLAFVDKNYNPIEARKQNKKLVELYESTKSQALSYETNLITYITSEVMRKIPDSEFNPEIFSVMSNHMFDAVLDDSKKKTEIKKQELVDKIKNISTDTHLTEKQSTLKKERAINAQMNIDKTFVNQQGALTRAKETVREAVELGCSTKKETASIVRNITEEKTKKHNQNKISNQAEQEGQTMKKEGPVLVKKKPTTNGNGFVSTITLIAIITSILVLGYLILK